MQNNPAVIRVKNLAKCYHIYNKPYDRLKQLLCKTLSPTRGELHIQGRMAALLELGAGFNPEFTGRENVYLNGAILGFSTKEMDRKFPDIEAFAEIGEF